MKPKLLVTASTFPRWEGDTEPRFILDLSKALLEYFDVTVLAPMGIGAKTDEVLEGVNVIRYHYFPIHKWETLCYPGAIVPRIKEKKIRALLVPFLIIALWKKLRAILPEYDLVQAHWIIPQGIIQSLFRKKFIVTSHGTDIMSMNNWLMKKIKGHCLRKAGAVTVVSEALKEKALSICKLENIHVISMGCDTHSFGIQYRIDNYFNQKDKRVVLFVGRLVEIKGVTYLIEAMRQLDAKLIIVGSGPLEKQLKKQAKDMGDKVQFLGSRTHEELRTIYASADVFVAPSITTEDGAKEGFGLVIIEAMSSGLPVIGSDSGGISEIVVNGENGFLVEEKNVHDLRSKIRYLLENPSIYQKLKEGAIKTSQKYDYGFIAQRYQKILNEILNTN